MANLKISELTALSTIEDTDILPIVETSEGDTKKVLASVLKTYSQGTLPTILAGLLTGWNSAGETWDYVSVDNPTGVIKVNADVTTKYSLGMRIKMTNGGNTIYGILTKIGTYGGDLAGYTYLTYLHEINPSNSQALHLMANSAITNNYYSNMKVPYGFPASSNKWTILYVSNETMAITTPTNLSWNSLNASINIPIGIWDVDYSANAQAWISSAGAPVVQMTLSTTTNSETDKGFTSQCFVANTSTEFSATLNKYIRNYIVTSKIQLNILLWAENNPSRIALNWNTSQRGNTIIKAVCNYL